MAWRHGQACQQELRDRVLAYLDAKWGEAPCTCVTLKPGKEVDEAALIAFRRGQMVHFKASRAVVFGPLPKASVGKMQKYSLRERARGWGRQNGALRRAPQEDGRSLDTYYAESCDDL